MHKRLKSLMIKEGLQIFRDPSSLIIAVILPLMLLFLYGYGVSLDYNLLKIGVCLEDTSEDAQKFLQSLQGSKYFDVTVSRTREPLYELVEKGEIRGFCVIPSYFSSFRQTQDKVAPIQVIADGSEANTANFVQYYIQGALDVWLKQQNFQSIIKTSKVVAVPRFWYNEELESRQFLLPGSLAITMTLIGSLLTALVVAREWERGTMESLIATEVTKKELLLGKIIPYFFLGMVSMGICVFFRLC